MSRTQNPADNDESSNNCDDESAGDCAAGVGPGPDDYCPDSQSNPSQPPQPEPADPDRTDQAARLAKPLIPPSVDLTCLPDILIEEEGDDARPPTVEEARDTYIAKARASTDSDGRYSSYEEQSNRTYPRILEGDRRLMKGYDDPTTAMLTRRISPLDENGDWLTPWELVEMLHGGGVRKAVRRALDYHLDEYEFEYVAVTAPTESAATPHEHIYLWIDDPEDSVSTDHLKPALDRHLEYCRNAYRDDHQHRNDGSGGAITVHHDPPTFMLGPKAYWKVTDVSETSGDGDCIEPNTEGAQYLASQLAHLPLGDVCNPGKANPPDALLEGAAIAWASSHHWFRTSRGFPSLDGGGQE